MKQFILIGLLVLASWITIWGSDLIMQLITHYAFGWNLNFGRWMTLSTASIFSLICAAKSELIDG